MNPYQAPSFAMLVKNRQRKWWDIGLIIFAVSFILIQGRDVLGNMVGSFQFIRVGQWMFGTIDIVLVICMLVGVALFLGDAVRRLAVWIAWMVGKL